MVLDQKLSSDAINSVLSANDALLGEVSINQHHDAVAGTATQAVTMDYQFKLAQAQAKSAKASHQLILETLAANGIKAKGGAESLLKCNGPQNDTVQECPVWSHQKKDFIVAVKNA